MKTNRKVSVAGCGCASKMTVPYLPYYPPGVGATNGSNGSGSTTTNNTTTVRWFGDPLRWYSYQPAFPAFAFGYGYPWWNIPQNNCYYDLRYGAWVCPASPWVWHPSFNWRMRWWM